MSKSYMVILKEESMIKFLKNDFSEFPNENVGTFFISMLDWNDGKIIFRIGSQTYFYDISNKDLKEQEQFKKQFKEAWDVYGKNHKIYY